MRMNVAQLKEELIKRGQPRSGNKEVLRQQLRDALTAGFTTSDKPVERAKSMNILDITVHWEILQPNPIPIPEPINEDSNLHPPIE